MESPATTPDPPYYAVIFTSVRTDTGADEYRSAAAKMVELASQQEGFLGVESARSDGVGITVSYWTDEDAIRRWKKHIEHAVIQRRRREEWYRGYRLRVARVERYSDFSSDRRTVEGP